VAKTFGVSRQPVREAFIRLLDAELVDIRPQRGTFVRKISRKSVTDGRFVREAIETAVVRHLAAAPSDAGMAGLRDLIARQRAVPMGDHRAFMALDDAFHRAIAHAAGCDYAWRVIEGAKAHMDRVRYLSLDEATPVPLLIEQHEAVCDALAAGDPGRAEAAMRHHLRGILSSLPQVAAAHPELFDSAPGEAGGAPR
jgi:DNA-binding GntR family transcriptional regulator